MSKDRRKASDLSEGAVVERAKSMANDWMWAISLQHDRIVNPRLQDQPFHPFGTQGFNEADIHFLVIALRRLRATANTLEHVPQLWEDVRYAIDAFDARLPWLKRMRDVFEHLEDYAEIADMEFLLIDEKTKLADFKKELKWNEMYYHLAKGL